MARKRASSADDLERRRREHDTGEGAVVDMRIDVVFADKTILSAGGRWDRRLGEYDGEPETAAVMRPHAGQVCVFEWFKGWMRVHAGRRDSPPETFDEDDDAELVDPSEAFSALLAGGRRGGKTWAGTLCCALYAVQFPGAIVWAINPNDGKHDEVRRYMSRILAPEWIARETADGWELINGSLIALKSAYVGSDPDAIKEGEAHLIWMNEGQKMAHRVYVVARGAISDRSGLVLVCANPPVQTKDEQWVSDFATDALAHRRASVYLHLDPRENPNINRRALLSMRRELDERSFRIEVLGEFLGPADAVAYNWIRMENEKPRPEPVLLDDGGQIPCKRTGLVDVTAEFLLREEDAEGVSDLPGLDVQVHPHIGGPIYRFYAKPTEVPSRDNVIAWIVDEVVLDGGDEVAWCGLLASKGYQPDSTLIVCDATAEYQHSRRRNTDSPPPEWKGKGSYDIIRGEGFHRIVPPSRRFRRKNPDIIDRLRAFTSMISSGSGSRAVRRLFVDPDRAPRTCESIRKWTTVHGKPSRVEMWAHLGDAASYPIVRLFPRILRSGKPGEVDPVTQRVDQPRPRPSFMGLPPAPKRPRPERTARIRGL